MTFSRGPKEPVPEVETNVWACTGDDCKGWMRESFSFVEVPNCPLCNSKMTKEIRILPEIR